ncbi:hypothetical protein [Campylobacter upsaliensis]|uniref:hypothetical protein n=1 Tax=Campylobacter upsaliensis TaxID=28080 RepID=UPI00214A58B2|nr:hypothetical protein [Campylobacter upsaliensis]MCR2099635.1 hypothetical protein [Campylobacter upsaliensis]
MNLRARQIQSKTGAFAKQRDGLGFRGSKFNGVIWQIRRIWAGRAFSVFTSNARAFS